MKFKFGDSWLDIWSRPNQKGRVYSYDGEPELIDFLIDPGAANSSIPKEILENVMKAKQGDKVLFKIQHDVEITTNWYEASFDFGISIGELDNTMVCHRFPGPVIAQLDKRHGVIGMDVLEFFRITALRFDWNRETNRLWKAKLDRDIFDEHLCS